ncbi:MAG: tetratricopeptide repeat protein, partial [Anaerolineales bacterium]|nr:tetratricopeptide repeat protein [Anaerolineales bacterium]
TLLAKQPTDRYTSAKQVIAALYHALGQRVPGETAVIRESYLQAATFVGRETEMVQLTAALNQAAKGSGSAWLIGGESGVGKTRLISELRTQALVSGFQVLRGQTVEDGGLPYQAWRQPVRHLVATSPDVDDLAASVLLPLVPDIAQLLNRPVAPAPELKEDAAQSRLFTTIARLFWRAERPLLLILEDLHLAQASLLPLPYLTRLVGDYPLLILGSYRSDDLPDLPDPLKTMTPLPLHRLSPAALTALSTAMLGESGQAEAIQSLLQRETEGNAFFAVEVVRALAEEAGHLGNIGQMILPQTLLPNGIRDIVQRRVDKLPEWAYPLLVKTAVAGRELNLPLVQRLADGIDVETKWLPLCADTAVLEVQDGTWQFTHSKIRDGLLATITQKQLEETHRQVAEAMVQLFNNAPERAGQLAYHWEAAGHHAKAAKAAFQAGQYAADQYANNEALHYLTQAFNLTPPQKLVQRYDILQKRQTVYELTGDSPSQKADLALLQAIADQLDDVEKQIVVQLLHANYLQNQAKFHEGIAIVATAVSRANQSNNPQLVAQGQLIWASLLENISDYTASFEHALKAKQIYETLDLRGHELYRSTLYKIASLYMRQEELDKTEQYLSQLRELDNNQYQKALMLDLLAIVKQRQGNHEKSEELSQAALAIMRAIGAKRSELKILNNLAAFCIDTNQHELAQKYQMQIMQLLREIGYSVAEAMNYGNIGLVQLLLGQLESSRKYCEIAIQISREIGHQYALATALSVVGQLYRTLGEVELARSVNEEGLRLKQAMNQPSEVVYILNNMGNLALDLEDWAAAEAHFKQSLKVLATIEFPEYTAEAHGGLTAVYANTHRLDLVREHLEAALAYVMTQPLHGYWEPFQTALNIYEVLITNRDSRALALLRHAYQSLQEQANALTEPENRRSFLENLPANKQVVALFEQFETEGWPEWKTAVFPTHHDREQDD